MDYQNFNFNNNIYHYQNEYDNIYIQNNNNIINNNKKNFNLKNKNQIPLNNNYIKNHSNNNNIFNNFNINNNLINNQLSYPFSTSEKYDFNNKNNFYNLEIDFNNINVNKKGLYKTPQSKSCERINFNSYKYYNNNLNVNEINEDFIFYDIRVDYCLQMLNLNELKKIFHSRNIQFPQMLYLSQKDMNKMNIPKSSQLIIQKFTKEYLQKASFYTTEELQRFFQLYYKNNIIKNNIIKNIAKNFIRSFSPIANNNKKLLNNKMNYINLNEGNIINNDFSELNSIENINMNYNKLLYNNQNMKKNKVNNKSNNINYINQRNCLSASSRQIYSNRNKRKENMNKNNQIQLRKYFSNIRQKNNSSSKYLQNCNSDNFISNKNSRKINNHFNNTNKQLNNNLYNSNMNLYSEYNDHNKNIKKEMQKNKIKNNIKEVNKKIKNNINKFNQGKIIKNRNRKFDPLKVPINNFIK